MSAWIAWKHLDNGDQNFPTFSHYSRPVVKGAVIVKVAIPGPKITF
jgi:hypothetical protein